mgnify:CR=1 FL=1
MPWHCNVMSYKKFNLLQKELFHLNEFLKNMLCKIYLFIVVPYIPSLRVCLATQKTYITDKPSVVIRFEPPSPIIENDHVNVTLHCDTIDGNPLQLLRVRWMMNGDKLTELPECNGKEEKFRLRLLWVLHLLYV